MRTAHRGKKQKKQDQPRNRTIVIMYAIGVSRTTCKYEVRQNLPLKSSITAGVYSKFLCNILGSILIEISTEIDLAEDRSAKQTKVLNSDWFINIIKSKSV